MAILIGKMRMPIGKVSTRASQALKMKTTSPKKKKLNLPKGIDDPISETISFVIKGHLTPLKSTVLATKVKKAKPAKKDLKVVAKSKKEAKKKKVPLETKRELAKSMKKTMNKLKKADKSESDAKVKKKTPLPTRKSSKPNVLDVINSLVLPEVQKAEVNRIAAKVKNEAKRAIKDNKQSEKVKSDASGQIKSDAVKRRGSPAKPDDKPIKKSEPKKIKKEEVREKNAQQEPKAVKQDKPKKNRSAELKTAVVKKDVKTSSKALKKEAMKAPVIKKEVTDKTEKAAAVAKKQQPNRKIKSEESNLSTDDTSTTSDEMPLDVLRQHHSDGNSKTVKTEKLEKSVEEEAPAKTTDVKGQSKKASQKQTKQKYPETKGKPKVVLVKKGALKTKAKQKEDKARKMKLIGLWNGPKRHRVASLNALAKVHCLYENETRGALLDEVKPAFNEKKVSIKEEEDDEIIPTRILRSVPGLRGVGKHWDMHDEAFSSSEEVETSISSPETPKVEEEEEEDDKKTEKKPKRRRNRCELIMDLKDMVVRKRMASLNASAILAASYSVEKRSSKSPKSESYSEDSEYSSDSKFQDDKKSYEKDVKNEEDRKVIEVRTTPNKKVSVILNQDTDVTITGVYVNSTTRSTHHEGYCSIAGMQYRISAKSHTQTASTTVATETIMQSAANVGEEDQPSESTAQPCKSYTPLNALSNMQPPGTPAGHGVPLVTSPAHANPQHVGPLPTHNPHSSPISLRHGCSSAFSAPPPGPYGPPPPAHHHPPPPPPTDPGYMHVVHMHGCQQRYYQPAGPLINVPPHGHSQPSSLGKSAPLSEVSSSPTPPPSHQTHSQSSAAESMDSDVIITSTTNVKEPLPPAQQQQPPPPPSYRYSQYAAPPHPGYSYGYPHQYYPAPPPPAAATYHHELCYPPNPYLHHKVYPPPTYRRHLAPPATTQYYQANPPDLYHPPPPSAPNQQSQQVVTATPPVSSGYQPSPSGAPPIMESYPPPPTIVEPYPPPPHYYPGYGPGPPPSCYTHSPPTRTLPYINAAYQSCPCPMQSCPKNVHTGPLTGDSKRSSHISSIAKDSLPLPPVALALPLEPVSATGPPSPARGSAGMPPPPSPAGATYQPPPPPKQEEVDSGECKPIEKRRKARVGKSMVRDNIARNFPENTMLLMCHPPQHNIKREIESPEERKPEMELKSKTDPPEVLLRTCSSNEVSSEQPKVQSESLKSEEKTEASILTPEKPNDNEVSEKSSAVELLPCVKTVAENVKVKNMKRKLSITKDLDKLEPESPPLLKKKKLERTKMNGSYKDLIKKNVPSIKINNGKRKLHIETERAATKLSKVKKTAAKRKLSPCKEESLTKRLKTLKPLTASNLHNSKQNFRNSKKCLANSSELRENKEPFIKSTKRMQVNSKAVKKYAPAILDSLFAKNSVDRTIDSVVTRCGDRLRALKEAEAVTKTPPEKCKGLKVINSKAESGKSTNPKSGSKSKIIVTKKVGACKRKSKTRSTDVVPPAAVSKVPRKSLQLPRWSNGWMWKGDPFQAKVFLNSDETTVVRKCYPAMKHTEGDIIEPRDCVLLKAGARTKELPFVAKIAALWENPDDGEMMMSLLWYYRPEHTEQGRQPFDEPDEVFASRHKDTNSVACIEDKCYVLTFNEYCRYRKILRRLEEGLGDTTSCIPNPEPYPRLQRQPPSTVQTPPDLVLFCRRVYDFRQKRIVKNPS